MKLLKKNKSLCFLLIIATIYVLVTLLYINPLREKNTKLEEKRNEILTLRQEDNSIQVFSEKEKERENGRQENGRSDHFHGRRFRPVVYRCSEESRAV